MPKANHPTPHPPRDSERKEGVVRMATAIPTMDRQVPAVEPVEASSAQVCTGHCGRCHVSPCQLHAKLAFRI